MGLIEELLKNKEELLVKFLEIMEGKESRAKIDLDGVEFLVGQSRVKLKGAVEFTFIPIEKEK